MLSRFILLSCLPVFWAAQARMARGGEQQAAHVEFDSSDFRLRPFLLNLNTPAGISALSAPRSIVFHGISFPAHLFRPQDAVIPWLVRSLDFTQESITIAMYELDIPEIGEALARAQKRGVAISLLMDQGLLFPKNDQGNPEPINPVVEGLIRNGSNVRILKGFGPRGIEHNKFALLDGALLIGGSYNWTEDSENLHFDNVVFENDPEIIQGYQAYWEWMAQASWSVQQGLKDGPAGQEPVLSPAAPPAYAGSGVPFNGQTLPAYDFSPGGQTQEDILRAILHSKASIQIAIFAFYDFRIASALVWAKEMENVAVQVLMDKNESAQSPVLGYLLERGVEVRLLAGPNGEGTHDRMHNKFGVFDRALLANGSFNYSLNAEKNNFENILFTAQPEEVSGFGEYFYQLWDSASSP